MVAFDEGGVGHSNRWANCGDDILDVIEKAISAISDGNAELAAFVLEKASHPNADADRGATMGWPPEVVSLHVTVNNRFEIEKALVAFIDENRTDKIISSAVWALGKAYNPDHRHLFENVLRAHFAGDSNTMFQAMMALNNLGVDFGGANSFSIDDTATNRELCRTYLAALEN